MTAATGPPPGPHRWRLAFYDTFHRLDPAVWNRMPWNPPWPPGSVTATDGMLTLRQRATDGWPRLVVTTLGPDAGPAASPRRYPNAFTWQGGYFEARMRYSDSEWAWPAFWLYGVHDAMVHPRPRCPNVQGEWDIAEMFGRRFSAAQHRNTNGYCDVPHLRQGLDDHPPHPDQPRWHVYGGLWAGGRLTSYIDGHPVVTFDAYDSIAQPMQLVVSLIPRGQGCCTEPRPAELEAQVDWVRVWQPEPAVSEEDRPMTWEQLGDIAREAAAEREAEQAAPPAACPNDGTPLEAGPDGVLFCRWDGFQWPRDAVAR